MGKVTASFEEGKVCGKCGNLHPLSYFPKNKKGVGGYKSICKDCHNENGKQRYKKNKDYFKVKHLRNTYSFCVNFENIMSRYYDTNICDCCGITFGDTATTKKCIDHSGNFIRGIICGGCNSGIGFLRDNIDGVVDAWKYLNCAREAAREEYNGD